jgi:2-dehydropantoate 2-reductase
MKITIAGGAGAMGSIFGGRLFQSGQEVLLYDVSNDAVAKINSSGLAIVDRTGNTETIPVLASTSPADAKGSDLLIIFTKCFHTSAAVQSLLPYISSSTKVLSLQNGWGNAQTIQAICGKDNLLLGVNYISGTVLEPGVVKQAGNPIAFIGRWNEKADHKTQELAKMFSDAGIQTTASDDVITDIWKKLALNVATLPTASLLRLQAHLLAEYEPVIEVMKRLLEETVQVANQLNIPLDYSERLATILGLLKNAVGAKGSMLQDVEAGRRTEIDVINGAIVNAGKELGIPVPFNESMVLLIKATEQNYLQKK